MPEVTISSDTSLHFVLWGVQSSEPQAPSPELGSDHRQAFSSALRRDQSRSSTRGRRRSSCSCSCSRGNCHRACITRVKKDGSRGDNKGLCIHYVGNTACQAVTQHLCRELMAVSYNEQPKHRPFPRLDAQFASRPQHVWIDKLNTLCQQ